MSASAPIGFEVQGAIFDVDDTLLDNRTETIGAGLHETSRRIAVHEVGRVYEIPALLTLTPEENYLAFRNARVHTLQGAIWEVLLLKGVVNSDIMDPEHPILLEIAARKEAMHADVLREQGVPLPHAVEFVTALHDSGVDKMAIGSSAIRRDIDIFLEMTAMKPFFPNDRIISYESISQPKPDPEVFNLAFASLGLPEADRAHTCAFEDDPRGIVSARRAGVYTCAITSRYSRGELESLEVAPHFVADDYLEMADHFGLTL